MIRTGIPVTVWESEGEATIATALRLLNDAASEPIDALDPNDPNLVLP